MTQNDDIEDAPGVTEVAAQLEELGVRGAGVHEYAVKLVQFDAEGRQLARRSLRAARTRIFVEGTTVVLLGALAALNLVRLGYVGSSIIVAVAFIPVVAAVVYRWTLLPSKVELGRTVDEGAMLATPEGKAHVRQLASIASLTRVAG